MAKSILGVHHVTAIAGDPDPNLEFDTRLLGLRLVKITVNFDDPASYHLYYGADGPARETASLIIKKRRNKMI